MPDAEALYGEDLLPPEVQTILQLRLQSYTGDTERSDDVINKIKNVFKNDRD